MGKRAKGAAEVNRSATVHQLKPNKIDAKSLMANAYGRMIEAQGNFSDIAVGRAIEIAADNGVDIKDAHILGVSFAPNMAVVAVLHNPKILAPGEKPGPKQFNIPVPAECLWADDWKAAYKNAAETAEKAHRAAMESGALDRLEGEEQQEQKTQEGQHGTVQQEGQGEGA